MKTARTKTAKFICIVTTKRNGQPNLDNIDSDEEYEIAADAFDELMDTEQFNEMEENSTEE